MVHGGAFRPLTMRAPARDYPCRRYQAIASRTSGFRASPLAYLDWVLLATLVAVPVAVAYWLGN